MRRCTGQSYCGRPLMWAGAPTAVQHTIPSPSTAAQVHQAQLLRPSTWAGARRDGLVAVKIQYPDALARMLQDLVNIRVAARFLQVRARLLSWPSLR